MSVWQWFLPHRRIGTRLVLAVTLAMTAVLLFAGGFVYWRVDFALNRQLDQDLKAYQDDVTGEVQAGGALPQDRPGLTVQVYAIDGTLLRRSDANVARLASTAEVRRAVSGTPVHRDVGSMIPPSPHPYRLSSVNTQMGSRPVVVVSAISRAKHDEALRELLLQLGFTDLLAIAAAALVGYGAARASLGPVERYRRAVLAAGDDPARRLPVDTGRDDELTRLGHTFNGLLARIEAAQTRERGFLADASHELRSPLSILSAEIEWAQHRPRSSEQMADVLASLTTQVDQLAALANMLLDLEELHGSTSSLDPQSVQLQELIATTVAKWETVAGAAGRRIDIAAPTTSVSLDRRWIDLALGNLISNALKHGSGTVHVRADSTADDTRFEVADEGRGMPEELRSTAFDRFTRAEQSRTTRGNGLGLALAKAVAESHGGTAGLGDGSIVYLEIPSRSSQADP